MNHKLDNIFEKEDYRYKIYELFKDFEADKISPEQLVSTLSVQYPEIHDGAVSKNMQLIEDKNPFVALWDASLQQMSSEEYEGAISKISKFWSDFMDYFFSMWYLRRSEELLNKKSEPLYK